VSPPQPTSTQEKYLITYLHAWSTAMEHAKNYDVRCKINLRTKQVAPFFGKCNLRFLSTKVLQGSVATSVNYGRIFIDSFTANLLQSVVVKNFDNRIAFRRVTGKTEVAPFFGTWCIKFSSSINYISEDLQHFQEL